MIKFFRHIRLSLLKEGKTTRYFKYALGEIILVVVGILIALQINNWNEHQKGLRWEQKFLKELSTELQENHKQLKDVCVIQRNRIEACKNIISTLQLGREDHKHIIDSLFYITQESNRTFFPTTGVYDLGLASGKLENLLNEELKYAIMDLYNHYYKRLTYNGELQDGVEEIIDWEKRKYFDVFTKKMKTWDQTIDPEFENQIQFIYEQTDIYTGLAEKTLSQIASVLEMAKQEIQ